MSTVPAFDKIRRWYENFSTVRSIFVSIGLWPSLVVLLTPVGVIIWSYLKHLPGPISFVLGLLTLATGLIIAKYVPEMMRKSVRVTLTPAVGPATIQLLEVRNLGAPLTFRAECTLLSRRNDPNLLHRSTFRMEWQGSLKRAVKLRRGGSCNLVIARANREADMDVMEICGLSEDSLREGKESSRWNHGDKLPEYDLKITIIGEDHRPHVECFTVKAGHTSALEMISISCE
jgi:hypothetical protein